jgi:alkanesulfonate monooxygenase
MSDTASSSDYQVRLFTTRPQAKDIDLRDYIRSAIDVSQGSEAFNCRGMLIYADNSLVDPWLVAQIVVENTQRLILLVGVQPIYMNPYSVAKFVSWIAHLHDRQIALNMVAGGFRNDLIALGDTTHHDDRYIRLMEYSQIIKQLLERDTAIELTGRFYSVKSLKMTPRLSRELPPEIFVSGSSAAGMRYLIGHPSVNALRGRRTRE